MLSFEDERHTRWLLLAFAVWASAVIGLVLLYLYQLLSPGKNASGNVASQYSRITSSTTSTVRRESSSHAELLDGCPVVFGSKPIKAVEKSDAVCFEIGEHSDITSTLEFRPRYVRVAAGYKLQAYGDVFFGEPLVYSMRGPTDMVVDNDAAVVPIKSVIVRLDLESVEQLKRECRVGMTLADGSETCLKDGTQGRLPDEAMRPARATVQRGYRMQAFGEPDLKGATVVDLVGPKTYVAPRTTTNRPPWQSLVIRPCGATLYSQAEFEGQNMCTRSDVGDLGSFLPKSYNLHEGCDLRAFDQPNFMGRTVLTASGPAHGNIEIDQDAEPWKSVSVVCTNIDDFARRDASRVIGEQRSAKEPCVVLYDSDPKGAGTPKSTNLPIGTYDDVLKTITFQPRAVSVPFGMRLVVKNRYSEVVYTVIGQTVRTDITASDWQTAYVSSVPT